MPYFDRFDICEAYLVFEWHWNSGGWLHERASNARRREATAIQLKRVQFKPKPSLEYETLEDNGKEIYQELFHRYFGVRGMKWCDYDPSKDEERTD